MLVEDKEQNTLKNDLKEIKEILEIFFSPCQLAICRLVFLFVDWRQEQKEWLKSVRNIEMLKILEILGGD